MSRMKRSLPIERASFAQEHAIVAWGLVWRRDLEDDGVWYAFHEGDHELACAAQIIRIGSGWKVTVYPDPERCVIVDVTDDGNAFAELDDAMCEAADELYRQRRRAQVAA